MKFVGVIAEFNPFSNGHELLIKKAKEQTGLPVLVIMSGNFVQRGELAIFDKYTRAKHAVLGGADIVIELPTIFVLSPARDFATGAIKILDSLPVSHLCFGSECGNLSMLEETLNILNSIENSKVIKENLKKGNSYSASVLNSLPEPTSTILKEPNNLLAIEYIQAIKKLGSKIIPLTVKRESPYNSNEIHKFSSSSALRNVIYNKQETNYSALPTFVKADIDKQSSKEGFNLLALSSIRTTPLPLFSQIHTANEGIENHIKKNFISNSNFDNAIQSCITKRYNKNKIMRTICNNLLGISQSNKLSAMNMKPYIKVLAINKNNLELLKFLSTDKATLLTKKADYKKLDETQTEIINIDLKASSIMSTCTSANDEKDFSIGLLKI